MKILMQAPTFSDKDDETFFFEWLDKLPGYTDVKVLGNHFLIGFDTGMRANTVVQLHQIFERWKINKSPLEALENFVRNPEQFVQ